MKSTELCLFKKSEYMVPARECDVELIRNLSPDVLYTIKKTKMRNVKFFRKWWSMIHFAFEHWEPAALPEQRFKDLECGKNIERFRKDITILAGHYDASYRLNGEMRVEAKSIAFDEMSEEEFVEFYKQCFDVIAKHVFSHYTHEELQDVERQLMEFI